MEFYRIAKARYIHDLSGAGARSYGGRWNHKGTDLVYTSESRSLAAVEYLVHAPLTNVPNDLKIAAIHAPDTIVPKQISISDLPPDWRDYPSPLALAELGTKWARAGKTLLLRVPSAVIEHEFNILVNPLHRDMKRITISHIEDFRFDDRLVSQKKK